MDNKEQAINEILEEIKKDELNAELIQDNSIFFLYNKIVHKVVFPTQKDNLEATLYKNKRYIQLLREKDTLTIKQLTKILKEKQDVDIEELNKKAKILEDELTQEFLTLVKKKTKGQIDKYKKQIEMLKKKRTEIVMEVAGYLAPAIENQVHDEYYRYLTSKCTYVLVKESTLESPEEKWQKVWKSFSVYEKDNSTLFLYALAKFTELMYGV